jgi:CheY-like chemotaxis protein
MCVYVCMCVPAALPPPCRADLQMPVMDGLEAATRLRLGEAERGTPPGQAQRVVGMSANVDADTAAAALGAGMQAFIPKPFTVAKLKDVCRQLGIHIFVTEG